MFAIIRVGGKQYRVEPGTQVLVDRLHVEPGSPVEGVEVLMLADGDDIQVGAPTVQGVPIGATAVRHHLGKKIRVFKYKAKKNYRRRIGSRPHQTLLRIDSIGGNNAPANRRAASSAPATSNETEVIPGTEANAVTQTTPASAPVAETVPATPADTTIEAAPVEVVAVVDAADQADAVAAIEDVPGVESVEVAGDATETE